MSDGATAQGPLAGFTVYEMGHSVAAPYAALILADLGARVIKVENPRGGDHARDWGPPFWEETAAIFHALNRGKESISVDISDPDAAAALRDKIVAEADAIIQNHRPGSLKRFGLDSETLTAAKPELICCDIGSFGPGPLEDKPGYDPLIQAFSGVMSVTGEGGDRPPVRVGVSLMDMGAGMWTVIGLLAGLLSRERGGEATNVQTSLYETGIAWMTTHLAGYAASGEVRRPRGSGIAEVVPYEAFRTQDGWLMVAAGNDGLFQKLCKALDRDDLAQEPRYATNSGRVAARDTLVPDLARTMQDMTVAGLSSRLDAAGVPNAPIQSSDMVMEHPHTAALGIFAKNDGDTLPLAGLPLTLSGHRPRSTAPTPRLGEHNGQ